MGKNGPWLPLKIWKKETSNDKVKLNLMDKAVKITALQSIFIGLISDAKGKKRKNYY